MDDGDRNGEPAEAGEGCLLIVICLVALALVLVLELTAGWYVSRP